MRIDPILIQALEELELSNSESKVYSALLYLQESQTGNLIKQAKISASKIYPVLDKLQSKGLVSFFLRNGIKQYRPAPPERVAEYIQEKKEQLEEKKQQFLSVANSIHIPQTSTSSAEVFSGWPGMHTVYREIYSTMQKGEDNYVIGATSGGDTNQTEKFFLRHTKRMIRKGVQYHIILNESAREYVYRLQKEGNFEYTTRRFIQITTPVEINVFGNNVALVRLSKEPMIFVIRDAKTATSFIEYYRALERISVE